jgi:hypothetical protein
LVRIGTISVIFRGCTRKPFLKLVVAANLLRFLDARGAILSSVDMLKDSVGR